MRLRRVDGALDREAPPQLVLDPAGLVKRIPCVSVPSARMRPLSAAMILTPEPRYTFTPGSTVRVRPAGMMILPVTV